MWRSRGTDFLPFRKQALFLSERTRTKVFPSKVRTLRMIAAPYIRGQLPATARTKEMGHIRLSWTLRQ